MAKINKKSGSTLFCVEASGQIRKQLSSFIDHQSDRRSFISCALHEQRALAVQGLKKPQIYKYFRNNKSGTQV